jgi:hypothetical protein
MKKELVLNTPWPFPPTFRISASPDTFSISASHINIVKSVGDRLSALGLKVVHINDVQDGRYKFTVVYRPCLKSGSPKMYEMAVAVCSPKDTYVRRVGTQLALTRFEDGEVMILPLAHRADAETAIRYMFSVL